MMNDIIQTAIEILKTRGIKGKFRGARISETNGNEVEFYLSGADGVYCIVNTRNGAVKGL